MATATHQAPTEAEIRAHVERRLDEAIGGYPSHGGATLRVWIRHVIREAASVTQWPATFVLDGAEAPGPNDEEGVWGWLTRHQADDLLRMSNESIDRAAARCEAVILEEITAGGVTFAAAHPDAQPAVPADYDGPLVPLTASSRSQR